MSHNPPPTDFAVAPVLSAGRPAGGTTNHPSSGAPHGVTATSAPYGHIPSFLPGAPSLVEQLDKRLLIVLRDGRHLVGVGIFITFVFALIPGSNLVSPFSSCPNLCGCSRIYICDNRCYDPLTSSPTLY